MTEDRDQDAFVRGFLKELSAKAPLHEWREAYVAPSFGANGTPVAAIGRKGRKGIWHALLTTFDQPTAAAVCREIQETIDAARALHGD